MNTRVANSLKSLLVISAALLAAACADQSPLEPALESTIRVQAASNEDVFATLRRVTARYHNIDAAIADGFVLLHPCEERGDEGPVGAVYAHFGRVLDGVIDPELPDALIYEPSQAGEAKLVGVEFAQPYPFAPTAPQFMGQSFQPEDEFGVWALHVWVWRHNPEGMFAETNPRVSCDS